MPSAWSYAQVSVSQHPRQRGEQIPFAGIAQAVTLTRSHGSQPDECAITFVPNAPMRFVTVDALISVSLYGKTWTGMVQAGPDFKLADGMAVNTMSSSKGNEIEIRFKDMRVLLGWDSVFGVWNREVIKMEAGERVRFYQHLYPNLYRRQQWSYTLRPLSAAQILNTIFTAPTVFSPWVTVYHVDLIQPVYEVDAYSGKALDEIIQEINDACGLTMTIEGGPYELRWMRKGEGIIDGFPENSDDNALQLVHSGAPQRMFVIGDRNLYLMMNLTMRPDWNANYEAFWNRGGLWIEEIYQRGSTAQGVRFNAIPGDRSVQNFPVGRQLAAARAMEITLAEYAALRGDPAWGDWRKFGGVSRMNMPVWLYLRNIVFRAFRPPQAVNILGNAVTDSMEMVDALPVRIEHDPVTGVMSGRLSTVVDGNGYAIVNGVQIDSEMFRNLQPDRFDLGSFVNGTATWRQINFQIDQSGEDGRFIVLEEPAVMSDNAVTVSDNGFASHNQAAVWRAASVRASLAFLWDKYFFTWPPNFSNAARDGRVNVPGLHAEYIVGPAVLTDANGQARNLPAGNTTEVLYADGTTANAKARALAEVLLRRQFVIQDGKYVIKLAEGETLPEMSGVISRLSVVRGRGGGNTAIVEFANDRIEPGRSAYRKPMELDRVARSQSLLPGQAELMQQVNQMRQAAGLTRLTGGMSRGHVNTLARMGATNLPTQVVRVMTSEP